MKLSWVQISRAVVVVAMLVCSGVVLAHPEDDLCDPNQNSLDPQLCAMLSQLNSAEGALAVDQAAMPLTELYASPSALDTVGRFIMVGVQHILPGGLDHILFVLAIFLAARRLGALVWQVSAFTLAHTMTLALAATGLVNLSADIIEPVIAFTIAFVAVENLFFKNFIRWRPVVVFVFGLLHGLGFASFFGGLELPSGLFWSALIGFNIGVEIGQLSIIVVAALAVHLLVSGGANSPLYQKWVVRPGSALIGLSGLWWGVSRLLNI